MRPRNLLLLIPILCFANCGGRSNLDELDVSGAAAAGGSATVGGQSFGGWVATAGVFNTGGMPAFGGAHPTGGANPVGGSSTVGGTKATGSSKVTGGATSAGGATGGTVSAGGRTSTGATTYTGGTLSTGGGACCGLIVARCNDGTYVGNNGVDCPQGAQCHVETQYCGACGHVILCADYASDAGAGGNTALGGAPSTGGSNSAGGVTSTGGTTSPSIDAGSGCTGSFETIQSNTSLCVAVMAPITGLESDAGSTDYGIDVTEVTIGQYHAWLATNPALPPSTDANCGYVTTYADGYNAYPDTDHHPIINLDWCDAYAYCQGVGKRLCGAIGGGSVEYSSGSNDAALSQWYRACSSGGANAYPYGNIYQGTYCNGSDRAANQTMEVGSLSNCVTSTPGYSGVYDLSGNIWEWEDSCDGTGPSSHCNIHGGSWGAIDIYLTCGAIPIAPSERKRITETVGFRCCSR
jgi:formylglycine-generating enzyme